MTTERTQAYRRVTKMLEELGPSKLQSQEQELIRSAIDTLIFSRDLYLDYAAREALGDVEKICEALVDSGRWERVTADRLLVNVIGCGPAGMPVSLRAA